MSKVKKNLRKLKKKYRRLKKINMQTGRNITCSEAAKLLQEKIQEFLSEQNE